jgi:hypothetical protein
MVASLVLLTPAGALLALGALVPLASMLLVAWRAKYVRRRLRLAEPGPRRLLVAVLTVLAAGALLGAAAAQPVLEQTRTLRTRSDAEAFVVVDISRSMLARSGPSSSTRLERAKREAVALRDALPEVPFGVASLTDRMLPHLFPSSDEDVFAATVDRSLAIEQPPPRSSVATLATRLEAVGAARTERYFAPTARKRLLIVFTDGESQPASGARLGALLRQDPPIGVLFVHLWGASERVFVRGAPEPQYRPDSSARAVLDGLARATEGSVYGENDFPAAVERARKVIGDGPTVVRAESEGEVPLAPYFAAAAVLPLAFVLWHRDR